MGICTYPKHWNGSNSSARQVAGSEWETCTTARTWVEIWGVCLSWSKRTQIRLYLASDHDEKGAIGARTELSARLSHWKCQARKTSPWAQLAIQDLESIPDERIKHPSPIQDFRVLRGLRCEESSRYVDIGVRFPQKVGLEIVNEKAA